MKEAMEAMRKALGVFIKDPKILAWLKENDPKALEQAEKAFGEDQRALVSCWNCDKCSVCKWGEKAEGFALDLKVINHDNAPESVREFMQFVAEHCSYYKRLEE